MKHYSAEKIRNIGLFSHGGAGKTSLAEAMLHVSGATTRLGKVEDGNTVTDFDVDEIKRGMSISLALAPVEYDDHKINVIDVPGYADFLGEVQSALAVVDAAVILLDASAGVEVGSEKAWSLATAAGVPKIIFVNKMDRDNADFSRAIDSARAVYGPTVGPLQLPIAKMTGDVHRLFGERIDAGVVHGRGHVERGGDEVLDLVGPVAAAFEKYGQVDHRVQIGGGGGHRPDAQAQRHDRLDHVGADQLLPPVGRGGRGDGDHRPAHRAG